MPALNSYTGNNIRDYTGASICFHETFTGMHPTSEVYLDRRDKNRSRKDQPVSLFECSSDLIFQSLRSEQSVFISSFLDMRHFIGERLYQVPQVLRVYCQFEHDVFYTWVVLKEREIEVQQRIYEDEDELIDRFPEFEFDFYTIYASGRDPDSLIENGSALVAPDDS